MIEITYLQMFLIITAAWISARSVIAVHSKELSLKRELQMLLVYICLVVIARFVYFPLHHIIGEIGTLKVGFTETTADMISIIPFNFLFDRYDGWQINIIGNIAMFIPFGILLPIIFNRFRVVSNILKLTVLMSVLIEVIQLILRRGIFETSDVIHNTMGGLIGFGFFCFIYRLLYIRPINIRKLIISLLPLIVVLFTFMSLALIYNFQEFGIMRQAFISRNNMDKVALRTECDFSDNNTNAMVYSSVGIASERQIDDFAEQFFSRQGVKYDDNQTLKVKKSVAYYMAKNSAGEELHLGIDYLALTYTYENFSSSDHDIVNVEKELLIDKLKEFGVDIPENAIYTRDKDGKNHFEIKNDVNGEMAVYGWLDCMFYDDESIKMICNHLVKCKPLREMKIFSEREAYEKIQKGLFRYDLDEPIETITINAVELIYEMDTKGFLQPVYKFEAIVNEEKELDILIPALK